MPLTHLNSLLDSNYTNNVGPDSVQHLCDLYSIYDTKNVEQQKEINNTYSVHHKTFRKAVCRKIIDFIPHNMKDTHNADISIDYLIFTYKAEEEDINNIIKYFFADQKLISNQCEQLGLDCVIKKIKKSSIHTKYLLTISNIKNFHVADPNHVIKDGDKYLKNNPDNIEEIWSAYCCFVDKYGDNTHNHMFPYIFNMEQISIFNDDDKDERDITKLVMFNKNISNQASVKIIYSLESYAELLLKYVEGKAKDLHLQCIDAGLLSSNVKTENGGVCRYIISIEYE